MVYLVCLVYLVYLVGRNENGFIQVVRFVSFNGLADRKTKDTRKPDELNKPEKPERPAPGGEKRLRDVFLVLAVEERIF